MSPPAVDVKREIPSYRAKAGVFDVIDVPPLHYLMIDGAGDPNTSSEYAAALASLYPLAYALKFFSKRQLERDYTVPPLEALWWADDMAAFTTARNKTQWRWTLLNLVPDWLTAEHVEEARSGVAAKGGAPRLPEVRAESLQEGRCAQTLHIGAYDDEAPVLARMHEEIIPGLGLVPTGRHHEIYLSDPRRTAPERLRTILRQPVGEG
jgi:hypothetical protein